MTITKTDIDAMPPNTVIWDAGKGSVSGFGVRRQRAYPVFVLKFRIGKRQRWHTIGKFGSPWTVDQARREAKRVLGLVAGGEDLLPSREESIAVTTMAMLCDNYMVAAKAGAVLTRFNRPKKASTLAIDVGRIERHIKPLIGDVAVTDVDSRTIRGLIQDITLGKSAADVKTKPRGRAVVKGGSGTAARVADLLSGIMTWAVEEGMITQNPVHGVRRHRSEPKQRFLSSEELARLGAALRKGKVEAEKAFHPHAITITKLLCLTGCRLSEIAKLRRVEFDAEQRCLRLEDTKSGRSLRAIGPDAVELLKSVVPLAGSEFLFPSMTGKSPYHGMNKEAPRIFEAAGLSDVTCHVLRHTFASVASELGYSDATIAGLLGHKGRGVTSRYVHRPDQALASAAEQASRVIAAALMPGRLAEGDTPLDDS